LATGEGLEPPYWESKSQVLPLNEPAKLALRAGLEPASYRLKGGYPSLDERSKMARAPRLELGSLRWKRRAQPIYQARELAEG
jgi:hypothetical protein